MALGKKVSTWILCLFWILFWINQLNAQDGGMERRWACWGSAGPPVVSAQCPRDTVLNIVRAGLKVQATGGACEFRESDCGCMSGEAGCQMPDVKDVCMGKSSCRLDVTQQYIGSGSCHGFSDYMYIEFSCRPVIESSPHDICTTGGYEQPSGFISSPNHPGQYLNNKQCECSLQASDGAAIDIQVLDLQLNDRDCASDYVSLQYDGQQSMFCGQSNGLRETIATQTSQAFISFHTDASGVDTGFRVKYQAQPQGTITVNCAEQVLPDVHVHDRQQEVTSFTNRDAEDLLPDVEWTLATPDHVPSSGHADAEQADYRSDVNDYDLQSTSYDDVPVEDDVTVDYAQPILLDTIILAQDTDVIDPVIDTDNFTSNDVIPRDDINGDTVAYEGDVYENTDGYNAIAAGQDILSIINGEGYEELVIHDTGSHDDDRDGDGEDMRITDDTDYVQYNDMTGEDFFAEQELPFDLNNLQVGQPEVAYPGSVVAQPEVAYPDPVVVQPEVSYTDNEYRYESFPEHSRPDNTIYYDDESEETVARDASDYIEPEQPQQNDVIDDKFQLEFENSPDVISDIDLFAEEFGPNYFRSGFGQRDRAGQRRWFARPNLQRFRERTRLQNTRGFHPYVEPQGRNDVLIQRSDEATRGRNDEPIQPRGETVQGRRFDVQRQRGDGAVPRGRDDIIRQPGGGPETYYEHGESSDVAANPADANIDGVFNPADAIPVSRHGYENIPNNDDINEPQNRYGNSDSRNIDKPQKPTRYENNIKPPQRDTTPWWWKYTAKYRDDVTQAPTRAKPRLMEDFKQLRRGAESSNRNNAYDVRSPRVSAEKSQIVGDMSTDVAHNKERQTIFAEKQQQSATVTVVAVGIVALIVVIIIIGITVRWQVKKREAKRAWRQRQRKESHMRHHMARVSARLR